MVTSVILGVKQPAFTLVKVEELTCGDATCSAKNMLKALVSISVRSSVYIDKFCNIFTEDKKIIS